MRILIGGVSQLFQGDLDLGRRAAEMLAAESWGPHVTVEDFHYGAVAVAQRLEEVSPDVLVLVAATQRGREPGTIERRRIVPVATPPQQAQASVGDAVTGYVDLDVLVDVCSTFGVLPERTVAFEIEPEQVWPSEDLSPQAERALGAVVERVRREVERTPLFDLADRLRARASEGRLELTPALQVLGELLDGLGELEEEGRWGPIFALRDELRLRISGNETGERMDHLDWSLWWALLEELDRLQKLEVGLGERR